MTFLVAIRSLRVLLGPMARQLSIATESLRGSGTGEGRYGDDELRRSLHIVRRRGRSIAIAVLTSIVPGIFWKLVLRL
jgi:hypothetical protein